MIWSHISTPHILAAMAIRSVILISASDGLVSPLGWLWTIAKTDAPHNNTLWMIWDGFATLSWCVPWLISNNPIKCSLTSNVSKNICSSGNRSAWYTVLITSAIRFGDWCISSSEIFVFPTVTRYGIRLSLTLTSYFFTFIFCPPYWFYLWKPKEKCFLFKHSFAFLSIFFILIWICLFLCILPNFNGTDRFFSFFHLVAVFLPSAVTVNFFRLFYFFHRAIFCMKFYHSSRTTDFSGFKKPYSFIPNKHFIRHKFSPFSGKPYGFPDEKSYSFTASK